MTTDLVAAAKLAVSRRKKAVSLRRQGKTIQEIGAALGITHQRVSQILASVRRENGAP